MRASVRLSRSGFVALLTAGVALLALASIVSLAFGAANLPLSEVWSALIGGDRAGASEAIVRDIRLPRILGAIVVGGTLASVGTVLQAVMKNPLAEPYILGISSGASVGAALAVISGAFTLGGPVTSIFAFATALGSVAVVYRVAHVGGIVPPVRLLLAGVALSSFATALTGFVLYLAPDVSEVRGVLFWLLGGLGTAEWRDLGWASTIAVPSCAALWLAARWQNLLLLGDEAALSLGLDVAAARKRLVLISALATGAVVAFSGAIGFVGLVVPHALRAFVGPDQRRLFPASFVFGAILLVILDCVARVIIAPSELPVGILSGLLGAPFFLAMLRKVGGGES
jgi:iron complex transport system permease protein